MARSKATTCRTRKGRRGHHPGWRLPSIGPRCPSGRSSTSNTPEDCVGKAHAARSLDDGVLLTARVNLGYSLVAQLGLAVSVVRSFLGITSWNELTSAKLLKVGCQSVYATAGGRVNRDEWAVPLTSQVSGIRLSAYHKKATPAAGQPVKLLPVPFWQWPTWVNHLANDKSVGVDDMEIDQASPNDTGGRTKAGEKYGVRVNAAGRPIRTSDGKFMSYKGGRRDAAGARARHRPSTFRTPPRRPPSLLRPRPPAATRGMLSNRPTLAKAGQERRCHRYARSSPRTPVRDKPAAAAPAVSAHWRRHAQSTRRLSPGPRLETPGTSIRRRWAAWPLTRRDPRLVPHGERRLVRLRPARQVSRRRAVATRGHITTPRSSGGGSSGNSWNDHQRAMGGRGLSRAEIRASYTPPTAPSRSSGGGGGYSSPSYSYGGGGSRSSGGGSAGTYSSSGSANRATLHTGSRGGTYYMTSGGNKRYV